MLRCMYFRCLFRMPQSTFSVAFSSAVGTQPSEEVKVTPENEAPTSSKSKNTSLKTSNASRVVAAAFASLKDLSSKQQKKLPAREMDLKISEAKNVDELLQIGEEVYISRRHALKVITVLAEWSERGRVKLSDFESDMRFVKLCRLLGRSKEDVGDLSLVLKVTGDDQAAKLISTISLPQMVKVMYSLCNKNRRSIPLLRSLAFNIGQSTDQLNMKQASDVLYSCAVLNFPDEVLLEKVFADIRASIKELKIPSVVSSILTSMGRLRYRNSDVLEDLCVWIVENKDLCRLQEFISALLTLANVNYTPQRFEEFYEIINPLLTFSRVGHLYTWLDIVWSLVVLQKASDEKISSVLDEVFVSKIPNLGSSNVDIVTKMKLLNINGMAKLKGSSYAGPLLSEKSNAFNVTLSRTKEKQVLVKCVQDTLENLLPSPTCLRRDVKTDMGYLIDGECYLGSNSRFLPLNGSPPPSDAQKVALMVYSYHDMCRGCCHNELTGISYLNQTLTTLSGYKVLSIPYTEFSMRSELFSRVKYLENRLNSFVNEKVSTS